MAVNAPAAPGVSVGFFHPAQDGLVFSNRRGVDKGYEPRPLVSHGAKHALRTTWDGMEHDCQEMLRVFRIFQGMRQFYDSGEIVEGVWCDKNVPH